MRTKNEHMLANEPIAKLIWKLSLPATVGMLVNALYNLVDTIFIGNTVGPMGIAGLAISFPLQMLMGGTGAMLGMGAASVISRSLGARNYEKSKTAFGNNLFAIVVFGGLFASLGTVFLTPVLRAWGATDAILPYATQYMGLIFPGSPLIIFCMSMNNVIRSEGAAKTAMFSMIIGALSNVALDALFIIGMDMGIKGAAIATILARVPVVIWIFCYYASGKSFFRFVPERMKPDFAVLKEIIFVGFPALVRHGATSFVFGMVNNLAAFWGGNLAVAVFGVVNRMLMFSGMPVAGIAQGMQPILGYSYGAGRYHRALETIIRSAVIATIYTSIVAVILVTFPQAVISIFSRDPEMLYRGSHAMRLMSAGFFVVGVQIISGVLFQALGKPLPSLILNTSRQILVLAPVLLVLPRFLGINGVWLSFPVADIVSTILALAVTYPQMVSLKRAETGEGEA